MAGTGSTSNLGFWRALWCPRCRSKRVLLLLSAVVLMSLGDLYMTLQYLLHSGLLEANPLARSIMQYGSPAGLIAWKLCTLILASGILIWARRKLSAELGVLFCCGVMTWLTVRWLEYSDQVSRFTHEAATMAAADDSRWVTLNADN